jgi:hypothetical protein
MEELLKFIKARIAHIESQQSASPMDGLENVGRKYELKIVKSFIEDGPEKTRQLLYVINDDAKEETE